MVKSIKSNLKQIWGKDGRVHLFGGLDGCTEQELYPETALKIPMIGR